MIRKLAYIPFIFIMFLAPAYAAGPSFDDPTPCDLYMEDPIGNYEYNEDCTTEMSGVEELIFLSLTMIPFMFMGGFWTFFICVWIFALAGFIFNVVMLIDCSKREEFDDKTLWIVLLVVGLVTNLGLIISLLYYLLVKKKYDGQ